MKRTTAATLIAAGIVGIVGGSVSAVVRGHDSSPTPDPTSDADADAGAGAGATPPSSTPSATPSAAPTSTNTDVLYAAAGKIHDGDRVITWSAPYDDARQVTRTADGYLAAFSDSESEPAFELWSVDPDGTSRKVADAIGDWDVSADGKRVVGLATVGIRLKVWTLDGGTVATWKSFDYTVSPVFAGDDVVVSPAGKDGALRLLSWNPDTGKVGNRNASGLARLTASGDGRLISGAVGLEGIASDQQATPCMQTRSFPPTSTDDVYWQTCDWSPYGTNASPISPDATLVWAVPAGSDGFGPTKIATFSATEGPTVGLRTFEPPLGTYDLTWLDDSHLLVTGATDMDLDEGTGTWLKKCDLAGTCTDVASVTKGKLVAGVLK